jgi:DDE superfamily endonuclease
LIRYWLTPPQDPHKEETVKAICTLYQQAPRLAEQGEQTVSTDEMTGVQALERKHPGLPLAPGKVERREFEYVRHGTRCFILSRDVVTGKLIAPVCGPTRTEADFLAHLEAVVATDPEARRWHIVCDQLNTHQSESLVRWTLEHRRRLGYQRRDRHSGLDGEPGRLSERSKPQSRVPFHSQA